MCETMFQRYGERGAFFTTAFGVVCGVRCAVCCGVCVIKVAWRSGGVVEWWSGGVVLQVFFSSFLFFSINELAAGEEV